VYQLEVKPRAAKDLDRLRGDTWGRVRDTLLALRENPRPHGYTKLEGGGYRIRVGDYRIIYDINDAARTVTLLRVKHRKDVYRGL